MTNPTGLKNVQIKNEYWTLTFDVCSKLITLKGMDMNFVSTSKKKNWEAVQTLQKKISKRKSNEIFLISKCLVIMTIAGAKFKRIG